MAQWIVRTRGEYPHLLPHLVQAVISRSWVSEMEMSWVVEMTDQEADLLRKRSFVESVEFAQLVEQA